MSSEDHELKKTPLYNKHLESGARMVPFSGWCMPVQYTSILQEHKITREKAGLFDISHMGEFFVQGESAEKDIDRIVTCRINGLNRNKSRYGFFLNDKGGIIDDMIVFKFSEKKYMLVVNAATIEKDARWIRSKLSASTEFVDKSPDIAKIDIQGPESLMVMQGIFTDDDIGSLGRFCFIESTYNGENIIISRTGYTGENGYEIFIPNSVSGLLWDELLGFDAVSPAGLGARDALRLEMGYSLYGHDIDEEKTPQEADLMKFVDMDKDFIGKKALLDKQSKYILTGFLCSGRRAAREGFKVVIDDIERGFVTSGAFSPSLKQGIGLCYIEKGLNEQGKGILLVKDTVEIMAKIKKPPFLSK